MEKSRVFSFGKVDFNKTGRRINEITLRIELRDWNGYPEFAASVGVWNNIHTDIIAGGQMIEEIYNNFPRCRASILYCVILDLWKKYHLHDISNIPLEDKEKIDLLFSYKIRTEDVEMLKELESRIK